jgi:hypothetical protein
VTVISYHVWSSDPFNTPEAEAREAYYAISGTPTTWFDGTISEVGGLSSGTMYPFFRHHITTRAAVDSPLEIVLTCDYDSTTNQGNVAATVTNTTGSAVSGSIHFALVEDNIPYNWGGGLTELDQVMRDMLPDASGQAVTVPASDTIIRSRDFTVESGWNEANCRIIVFVQAANRQIYQGAQVSLIPQSHMVYYGMTVTELTGNGNGYGEPGEEIEVTAYAKNMGSSVYTLPAAVQCSDPYISITSYIADTFEIYPGDVDDVITWTFDISATCPDPHLAEFNLVFGDGNESMVPYLVTTQSGFTDDMESGEAEWTHYGTYDNWHLTEHKSNSPTHSWYCGVENIWHYLNQNDLSLVSPYFIVAQDSIFSFYHQYNLETNWDYTYAEFDNGSGWWQTLDEYNGLQSTWTQEAFSLASLHGQTVRVRFRLVSDYSTYAEGWYIDDVWVSMTGINELENPEELKAISLNVSPTLFSKQTTIYFSIGQSAKSIELKIYDATGRLVKSFNPGSSIQNQESALVWNGNDNAGRKLPSGIYFITLQNGDSKFVEKAVLLR